jgi:8-oxo-dGTP pyrophosphatase MutT (NUDIX family)/S1-C subfamily serine protease
MTWRATPGGGHVDDVVAAGPDWLRPVADLAAQVEGPQLSRFLPPEAHDGREGAVLVLFGEGAQGPDVLLIERAHDMRSHAGQPAFPGGAVDPDDDGPVGAALREAQEETGLDPAGVAPFASLPALWLPPSNFVVTPVMAWWRTPSPVAPGDPREVAGVVRVPIDSCRPRPARAVRHPAATSARRSRWAGFVWASAGSSRRCCASSAGRLWSTDASSTCRARRFAVNVVDIVLVVASFSSRSPGGARASCAECSPWGLLAGAAVAVWFVPDLVGRWDLAPVERGLVAVGCCSCWLRRAAARHRGGAVAAGAMTWRPAEVVDAVGGAAFSLLALAVVVFVVASAVAVLPDRGVASAVRSSSLLARFDAVVPDAARDLADGMRSAWGDSAFPRVFAGITEPVPFPVDPPDAAVLAVPAVRRASGSLVRVEGVAPACQETVTGSGFVYADHRVMTNAHVVAGVPRPRVRVMGRDRVRRPIVLLDRETDVAVLTSRPHRAGADVRCGRPRPRGRGGIPGGSRRPQRGCGQITARGRDIGRAGCARCTRRGQVRLARGGPLLAPDGSVLGWFAASVDDADTGYALTAAQVADAAASGRARVCRRPRRCAPV